MLERKISGIVILTLLVLSVFVLCAFAIGLLKAIAIWAGFTLFLGLMIIGINLLSD